MLKDGAGSARARPLPRQGFCDPSLSIDERVADLRNRLSLEEKVYMTQPSL